MKCRLYKFVLGCVVVMLMIATKADSNEVIIKDDDISISKAELSNAIKYWAKKDRSLALKDYVLRQDLINSFIINYKLAGKSDEITAESDPVFYWQSQFAIRNLKNKMYIEYYSRKLKVPDMMELAKEVLMASRDKFATLPEKRKASHILLKCMGKDCNRGEKKITAEKILKKLKEGAKFEELVEKYSDDHATKIRQGKVKEDLVLGGTKVDPRFVSGAFSIDKVGEYSGVVSTRFGLHIIRLDELIPSSFKPDKEVLPSIVTKLEKRYKLLSKKVLIKSLRLSKESKVNQDLIDEILKEYTLDSEVKN